jgi:hypothetical protein
MGSQTLGFRRQIAVEERSRRQRQCGFPGERSRGILSGLAAILTALTGLYVALRSTTDPSPKPDPSHPRILSASIAGGKSPGKPVRGTPYMRAPWMGVEPFQDDEPIEMRSSDDAWCKFEASLDNGSFELRITRSADDPMIGIFAWHDESIFGRVAGEDLIVEPGITGARFAVPILYLDKEGFNVYDNERLKYLGDDKCSIFVSTIGSGELELPLPRFAGPIYLIVFQVPEGWGERIIPKRRYEFLTLRR